MRCPLLRGMNRPPIFEGDPRTPRRWTKVLSPDLVYRQIPLPPDATVGALLKLKQGGEDEKAMTGGYFNTAVVLAAILLALSVLSVSDAEAKKYRSKVHPTKGAGQVDIGEDEVSKLDFTFDAKGLDENVATDAAKGNFSLRKGNAFVKGRVTCLRVRDGNALVKGRIDKTSDGDLDLEELFVQFHAVDSAGAKGKMDELGPDISTDSSGCGNPTGGHTEPIFKCSIVVRDTPNL